MKITVLCSDALHPVNAYLNAWVQEVNGSHNITIARSPAELTSGDFLFLLSCSEVIKAEHKESYCHTLVLHASDLPKGRGWSPHIWDIIQGREVITLSLLEAEDKVDSGRIWLKRKIPVDKTAIWFEVNHVLFEAEIKLINEALINYDKIKPYQQGFDIEPTYYRKRTPDDSRVDPHSSISDQFDLIRMCDPDRYPAWFEMHGQRYKLVLEKLDNE
ncbi:formyltransferase family protein [Alphaproteobacteria bacterium LSUCC0396]